MFLLEPKQIFLFNFPFSFQAEIFIIPPLNLLVQKMVDMHEIVAYCDADHLKMEQILLKKMRKRDEMS